MASRPLLTGLLKDVSRSFYLTMRVLPGAIRPPISLAYLLARTTDTVADTALLPLERRLDILRALRDRIVGTTTESPDFKELGPHQSNPAEAELLVRFPEAMQHLEATAPADRDLIRAVLSTIISGQELDLRRFGAADADHLVALVSDDELDDYTYRVAGCVGEFWTRLCLAHLFGRNPLANDTTLLSRSVRFGKGLQMVNILRDLAADLRHGRCYIPSDRLRAHGLSPAELLEIRTAPRFRSLYEQYLALAWSNLEAGWDYTNSLPYSAVRTRLACAWPILIGAGTLARLWSGPVLDPGWRAKTPRGEVYATIARTVLLYPWRTAWAKLFASTAGSWR